MYSGDVGRVYFVKEDGTIEDANADAQGDAWPPRDLLHGTAGHSGASMVYAVPQYAQVQAKAITSTQQYAPYTEAFVKLCTKSQWLITSGCSDNVITALKNEQDNTNMWHVQLESPADARPLLPPPPHIPLSLSRF